MIRIACTAIERRIKAGRVAKDGLSFVGETMDVTNDCLKAFIEFIGVGETKHVYINGITYEISINLSN